MIKYPDEKTYIQAKVAVNKDGCWLWQGALIDNGYAHSKYNQIRRLAHRFSYEIYKGEIPAGLQIDHLCRVRHCINPEHLEPVTPKENIGRSLQYRVFKANCPAGHPYSGENVRMHLDKKRGITGRLCRTCHRERNYATWLKMKKVR